MLNVDIWAAPAPSVFSTNRSISYHTRLVWFASLNIEDKTFQTKDIYGYINRIGETVSPGKIGHILKLLAERGYFKRVRIYQSTAHYEYTPTWKHKALRLRYRREYL